MPSVVLGGFVAGYFFGNGGEIFFLQALLDGQGFFVGSQGVFRTGVRRHADQNVADVDVLLGVLVGFPQQLFSHLLINQVRIRQLAAVTGQLVHQLRNGVQFHFPRLLHLEFELDVQVEVLIQRFLRKGGVLAIRLAVDVDEFRFMHRGVFYGEKYGVILLCPSH